MPGNSSAAPGVGDRRHTLLTCAGLAAAVGAIYGQALGFDFVNFDDDAHITENEHVVSGLSGDNLVWDFGIHGPSQWHPLAWLSHQVDCALYGLNPAGHHATSVLLHALAAILLFITLQQLLGRWGVAAFTGLAFAVHPLNVESVAWASERRNVLCAVFSLLTIRSYIAYVRRPSSMRYGGCLAAHVAALMAKPLAVTIPCVLWLLDYWPLNRVRNAAVTGNPLDGVASPGELSSVGRNSPAGLVFEKLPLLLASAASAVLSIQCQRDVGTVASLEGIPLSVRLANAVAAYGWYLRKMVWPTGLTAFYPHPAVLDADPWPELAVPAAVSAIVVAAVTVCAVRWRARYPWLAVGWFWYLGMLVPMIGIVQVGEQQQADRYAYLPLIGLFLIIGCVGERLAQRSRHGARWVRRGAVGLLCGWGIAAFFQTTVWHDSVALFTHALEVAPRNHWAEHNLGQALLRQGKPYEAAAHFQQAIRIAPTYALAHYNLGIAWHELGHRTAARMEIETSLTLDSHNAQAHQRLGAVILETGQPAEAIEHFREAARLAPDDAQAQFNLGVALAKTGHVDEAIESLQRARRLKPDWAEVRDTLATIQKGK